MANTKLPNATRVQSNPAGVAAANVGVAVAAVVLADRAMTLGGLICPT